MDQFAFVFTIFFSILGPVKIIPAFAGLTRGADDSFRDAVAIRAGAIAAVVVAFIALVGTRLLGKYHISYDGLRIAGGLVLLLAALNTIFSRPQAQPSSPSSPTPISLAVSPLVSPIIVAPAGVAAILIFMMLAPKYPGMTQAVVISLAIIMLLDFLAMRFNRAITSVPGLTLVLQLLGAVLIFMQVALAVEAILESARDLGVIPGSGSP